MKKVNVFLFIFGLFMFGACQNAPKQTEQTSDAPKKEVNVYSHRLYETDEVLFAEFEKQTGIKVNTVKADADELLTRIQAEGEKSPADVLLTVDAGRLYLAKAAGVLQAVTSEALNANVPTHLRDSENYWFGLTQRARVLVYSKERVKDGELTSYEDLMKPRWKGKVLVRSSSNMYNQSLLAAIIAHGKPDAKVWAKGVVANFAREPKGNDRDQVKAIAQGLGDVALVNTYYIGLLLNSKDAEEKKAGEAVKLVFPKNGDNGTHINISGAGVLKYAPNRENAVKFIEFLTSERAQRSFSDANYEYPVNAKVQPSELLRSWGSFTPDTLAVEKLGIFNKEAVKIFDQVGWK